MGTWRLIVRLRGVILLYYTQRNNRCPSYLLAAEPLRPRLRPSRPARNQSYDQSSRRRRAIHLFFEGRCDVPRFRAMLTDDVEFYHDKVGSRPQARGLLDFEGRNGSPIAPSRSNRRIDPGWGVEVGELLFIRKSRACGVEPDLVVVNFDVVREHRAEARHVAPPSKNKWIARRRALTI